MAVDASGPVYNCQLSTNSGATVSSQGITLLWDPASQKWKNASWVTGALTWIYWIKQCGQIGTKPIDKVLLQFNDPQTNDEIDAIIDQWVKDIRSGADGITDATNASAVDNAVAFAKSLKEPAYNGQYWSLYMLRYLTQYYFAMLRAQMTDGNTSLDITLKVKRFTAVFGVLDSSNFFSQKFVDAFRVHQLASLLPAFVDFGNNQEEFGYAVYAVLESFVSQYANSSDPAMQARAQQMEQLLAGTANQRMIEPFITAFLNAAATSSTNWKSLIANFEVGASKIGNALGITGRLLDTAVIGTEVGFGSVAIAFLISGKIG